MRYGINSIRIENFRRLKDLNIDIGSRITLVAGHNGVGKSTILGLIANGSGTNNKNYKSLFGKNFQSQFNEIFSLDLENDYEKDYSAYLDYTFQDSVIIKKCTVSKHLKSPKTIENNPTMNSHYLKIVPRTYDNENNKLLARAFLGIGANAKVPIPTIYVGMSRMVPNGELEDALYRIKATTKNDGLYEYYSSMYNEILGTLSSDLNQTNTFQEQDIKYSNKKSLVPYFDGYSARSMSLGQDSLTTILTAVTSFYHLSKLQGDSYTGGILVIDEVDSGLHPYAQVKLFEQLEKAANELNLQIICTTHSLTLLQKLLQRKEQTERNKYDEGLYYSVAYIQNTRNPKLMKDPTYKKIKNDMLLQKPSFSPLADVDKVKIYFEDNEAKYFLNEMISFDSSSQNSLVNTSTINLDLINSGIGSDTLLKLPNKDSYFKSVLICCDGDITTKEKYRSIIDDNSNIFTLPTQLTPEEILIEYLKELITDEDHQYWKSNDQITSQMIETLYLAPIIKELKETTDKRKKREKLKDWWKLNFSFIQTTNLVRYWCEDNPILFKQTMTTLQDTAINLVRSGNYLITTK